jgi:uncharacterized protein (UPF0276 family)
MKTLGFGLGLRTDHYDAILSERPAVGFFEALTENHLVPGGKALHYTSAMRMPLNVPRRCCVDGSPTKSF